MVCALISIIYCVFHLLYQVFYGVSIRNICNDDGVHNTLYRNMLSSEQKLACSCLCFIDQTPDSYLTELWTFIHHAYAFIHLTFIRRTHQILLNLHLMNAPSRQPFKCPIHSCRGLELQPRSLHPNYIMVCGQIHALVTSPNYVHTYVMKSSRNLVCFYSKQKSSFIPF
jgi:hypothetical protein